MPIFVEHTNPVRPITGNTADELTNAYQALEAHIRGEQATQQAPTGGYNPHDSAQPTQEDEQKAHIANMAQYHAPVGINKFNTDISYTDAKHTKFAKQLENDPAFKEFADPLHAHLTELRAAMNSGQISPDQAIEIFSQYGREQIDPVLHKHHGAHSDSHMTTLHDDIPEDEPEIVKKAKGGK